MSFDLKINKGDFVIKNGQLQTVTDSEKLIQDILKVCLTSAGSNPLHPWYGSFISRTIIGNPLHSTIVVQIAKTQLDVALKTLKELQEIQVKSFQRVSADEQISAILDISIIRNQIDPRLFDVRVRALTKGLKPITTAFRVSTI
jgi:multidrug efflux pump subunit AcrA (membrane-fusion protein)